MVAAVVVAVVVVVLAAVVVWEDEEEMEFSPLVGRTGGAAVAEEDRLLDIALVDVVVSSSLLVLPVLRVPVVMVVAVAVAVARGRLLVTVAVPNTSHPPSTHTAPGIQHPSPAPGQLV